MRIQEREWNERHMSRHGFPTLCSAFKPPTQPLSFLQALTAKGVQAYNTRLFKRDKNGKTSLDVLVASARTDIPPTILEEGSATSPQVRSRAMGGTKDAKKTTSIGFLLYVLSPPTPPSPVQGSPRLR
jgi:hypothetical protein